MQIVNLRSTSVAIVNGEKLVANYPTGTPAICTVELKREGNIDGAIVYRKKFKDVQNLPGPEENPDTMYIVDDDVAEAVRDSRVDLLIPNQPVEGSKYENAYDSLMMP